jgi:heme oxygenase (biliverdin-IX-beta and delta-forming)
MLLGSHPLVCDTILPIWVMISLRSNAAARNCRMRQPVTACPSAIAGLRAATWPSHQRLEKRLDVKTRFSTLQAYRTHLERLWGFCAELELRLAPQLSGDALPDFESRRKLPLLAIDLRALGADSDTFRSLPRCRTVPQCHEPAAALGCAYVMEGATLGGRTLLPLVLSRLGLTPEHGATFLASYGQNVASMWQIFGAALDGWCSIPQRQASAAAAAAKTFDALGDWLCEARS